MGPFTLLPWLVSCPALLRPDCTAAFTSALWAWSQSKIDCYQMCHLFVVILRNLVLPGISNFQNDFRWCAMDYEMHSATLQSKEERGSHLPQYSQCKCSNPHQAWILSLVQTAPLVVVFFSCSETPSIVAWAVSQHTDSSKNTQATLKCCYTLHSYVGTISNHDKLLE